MADVLDKLIDPHTADFLHEAEASKFDFHLASTQAAGDDRLKRAINFAVLKQDIGRRGALAELPDSEAMRNLAGAIKQHTLDHLDYYLEQLAERVAANGGHVHFASTGDDARRIVLEIAKQTGSKRVIKSKSMASEEIELTPAMERAGLEVYETDLGEFIAQLAHEKPSHLVAPIVHKNVASIAKLFSEHFKVPYSEDPNALTALAREFLRGKFRHADMGMTGGNFLVAESGQVCVVENEGNARQSITSPRVLVSMVGIEKLVPRVIDLSVFLKLLARSATGQPMTVYTSLFGGPRTAQEKDGPEEFHLILLDNGRTGILAGEYRETLRCIRCAACLNACPIYRNIGGHSYGSIYPGPIGALITPLFQGLGKFKDLPQASSLCGACYEACPVKINIPKHLINLRRDIVGQKISGPIERLVYRLYAWSVGGPFRYRWSNRFQKWEFRRRAHRTGWVRKLPLFAAGWTQARDMPAPAKKTFHELWKKRK